MASRSIGDCCHREPKAPAQRTSFWPPSRSSSCRSLIGLRFDCGLNCGFGATCPLGHALLFIGELSLFFINALAVVILFDRSAELEFVLWKVLLLVAILFAICTYKYQLSELGGRIIEGEVDT